MGIDNVIQQTQTATGQPAGKQHGVSTVLPERERRRGQPQNEQRAQQQPQAQAVLPRSPQVRVNGVVLDTQTLIFYGVVLADILLLLIWMGA